MRFGAPLYTNLLGKNVLSILDLDYRRCGQSVLSVPSFALARGEHALLLGPSGAGKSTLLHLLAAILSPQAGRISVDGVDIGALAPREADRWRGRHVGYLPQQLSLLASLSVRDNVLLPGYASGQPADPARADALLAQLGLAGKAQAKPHQLSGGQRQRVAIARAVLNRPRLLLADEPTASLDDEACQSVTALLLRQAQESGASLIIASHDARLIAAMPVALVLRLPAREGLPCAA
ncbi:ATP-binding cassette domain-containing protein [Janthinobacterium aquaticum]|nr:ATP-binding cassette domain-containing protein [Janthinobacterium sp. FT58W]